MFQPDIAAAVASYFLGRSSAKALDDLTLMKLMYLAERRAIETLDAPIIGARFVSMPKGPVLSEVLDLMNGNLQDAVWSRAVRYEPHQGNRSNRCCLAELLDPAEHLSEAELGILAWIWDKYSSKGKWQLVALTHEFPEWDRSVERSDAPRRSTPIRIEDILHKGLGLSPEEARERAATMRYFESA